MELENIVDNCKKWVSENIIQYQGDKAQLKNHIGRAAAGGATILVLNVLNAPDLVDVIAYAYTSYQCFKSYKDLKQV